MDWQGKWFLLQRLLIVDRICGRDDLREDLIKDGELICDLETNFGEEILGELARNF